MNNFSDKRKEVITSWFAVAMYHWFLDNENLTDYALNIAVWYSHHNQNKLFSQE